MIQKRFSKIFLVGVIVVAFGLGAVAGRFSVSCEVCAPSEIDFSLFWQAWKTLEEKFAEPEKLNIQQMIYGAVSGMVKSLEDPYTVFLDPEETKKFEEDVKGVFEGVGMEIGMKKGELLIIAPLEGTPAMEAGLLAGDKIIKIGDIFTRDITIDEAVTLIRGPKATEVVLTIMREGWEKPKEFKVKRAVIEIPSLKWELKDQDIAYLKLYHFSETARFDFRKAALEIISSPAKKIVLDLRNNPGGYLEVAQEIAGWFLKRGQIVAIEDFGEAKGSKEYKAEGPEKLLNYPVVVLINQGSASGSEILAAALRDNRGVKIIGEKSFGKGSVQELERLRGGSSLKITVAKWLTPKGELITDVGLEPDVIIEMTEEDYEQGRDPQLDKAIEIIKNL